MFRYRDAVMGAFVKFISLIFVSLPSGDAGRTTLQGSLVAVGCCVGATSSVGDGIRVSVGSGVGLGVSVGGMGVAVGMAACVSAPLVDATTIAVFCMSTGLIVGVASAPQALITIAKIMTKVLNLKCFILVRHLLLFSNLDNIPQCQNLVISHNDFPSAFGDAKPATL